MTKMASEVTIRSAQVHCVHVPDPCAWCESIKDVNWFCNDCQEPLCDACKVSHQRAKKTRNDVVVPISKATKQDQVFLPDVCKTHHGKSCDLYCYDCEIAMCVFCLTEKHSQHVFKPIEEEIKKQKQVLEEQLLNLNSKLEHFNEDISKRHEMSKSFEENVNTVQQAVQNQRLKMKANIISIADSALVELSSLLEEEEKFHIRDCQSHEKNVIEIKQLKADIKQTTEKKSSASLFEMTRRMTPTLPLCDLPTKSVLQCQHSFVPGELKKDQLKTMFGYMYLHDDMTYEKKEINCQRAQIISSFQVPQRTQINAMCPTDDDQVWMSLYGSCELIKVNKEGNVKMSVKLSFKPGCLTLSKKKKLLITENNKSSMIHSLSQDRQVTRFANISPLKASGISNSGTDEVFVTTLSPTVLVLNMSGEMIRQISCGGDGLSIVRLKTGNIAVTTCDNYSNCIKMHVINQCEQVINKWNGELDNGQTITETSQSDIACDRFDRIFLPDYNTSQVYVLEGNESKAKCLLDKKHTITDPWAVCVDMCGHVWVGCSGGNVHVMEI